jgi:predicted phosphoribosyltransferase
MSNDQFFDDFSEVTDDKVVTALSRPVGAARNR